jgi:hypothetical protein
MMTDELDRFLNKSNLTLPRPSIGDLFAHEYFQNQDPQIGQYLTQEPQVNAGIQRIKQKARENAVRQFGTLERSALKDGIRFDATASKGTPTNEQTNRTTESENEDYSALIARAMRILLLGEILEQDYLGVPGEINAQVDLEISKFRSTKGIEITIETKQWMLDNYVLQYYCSEKEVACLRTGKGVIVLALGSKAVVAFLNHIPSEHRTNVIIEYP